MFEIRFGKIESTTVRDIADGKKRIEAVVTSEAGAAGTADVYGFHGFQSRPAKGVRCLRLSIGKLNFVFSAFSSTVEPPANPGEVKVYSTDADGVEQASILLDATGNVIVNAGTNHATQYEALLTAFNQLKADFDGFVTTKFNLHTHPGVSTGSGSTAVTPLVGAASTADMTPAKVEEVKIP